MNSKIDYDYRYLQRLYTSIPEYIKRNLKKMPNNKGYLWKGMSLYGALPKEEDTIILFENIGHDLLKIHEITQKEYKVFEKKDKQKRTLLLKEKRKQFLLT